MSGSAPRDCKRRSELDLDQARTISLPSLFAVAMYKLDWTTVAWSVWTALLAIAILYLLFYP
jgi:hypothetical protein